MLSCITCILFNLCLICSCIAWSLANESHSLSTVLQKFKCKFNLAITILSGSHLVVQQSYYNCFLQGTLEVVFGCSNGGSFSVSPLFGSLMQAHLSNWFNRTVNVQLYLWKNMETPNTAFNHQWVKQCLFHWFRTDYYYQGYYRIVNSGKNQTRIGAETTDW